MNKNIKVMGSVILSAVLAQSMLPLHVYALEDENPLQKTETVYAVLNADGSISIRSYPVGCTMMTASITSRRRWMKPM